MSLLDRARGSDAKFVVSGEAVLFQRKPRATDKPGAKYPTLQGEVALDPAIVLPILQAALAEGRVPLFWVSGWENTSKAGEAYVSLKIEGVKLPRAAEDAATGTEG